jgi:hypothetical protein
MSPAAHRWSEVLADADRSGLSLRAFARREGHNPNTLAWWRWNLRRQRRERRLPTRLAQVVVVEDDVESTSDDALRVRVAGADIHVDQQTDLDLLRRVVEALR